MITYDQCKWWAHLKHNKAVFTLHIAHLKEIPKQTYCVLKFIILKRAWFNSQVLIVNIQKLTNEAKDHMKNYGYRGGCYLSRL